MQSVASIRRLLWIVICSLWRSSSAAGNADALKAGTDMACTSYANLHQSLSQGLVSETDIDTAVARVLASRMRLGIFDPPADVPYSQYGLDMLGSPTHRATANWAAQRGACCAWRAIT